MRVTFVVSHLQPVLGLERSLISLLKVLPDDVDADVVCVGDDHERAKAVWPNTSVLGGPLRGWRRILSVRRGLRLRHWQTDVFVLVGAWAAVPVLMGGRRIAARSVVWEHSFDSEKLSSSSSLRLLKRLAEVLYNRAVATVVVSETLASDVSKWLRAKPAVIPNVLERNNQSGPAVPTREEPGPTWLVSAGSLTPTKNQQLAIRALSHLPQSYHLRLLGEGPLRQVLEQLADQLGLGSRVVFEGMVESIRPWVLEAKVVVHPALGETFGLVLFEAAEMNRPVVALDRSAMREAIADYVPGVLVPDDPVTFAKAVSEMVELPPSADDFRRASERRGRRFDSETIAASWVDVLRIAMSDNRSRGTR